MRPIDLSGSCGSTNDSHEEIPTVSEISRTFCTLPSGNLCTACANTGVIKIGAALRYAGRSLEFRQQPFQIRACDLCDRRRLADSLCRVPLHGSSRYVEHKERGQMHPRRSDVRAPLASCNLSYSLPDQSGYFDLESPPKHHAGEGRLTVR